MTEKERITQTLTELLHDANTRQKESTNGMMAPQLVTVNEQDQSAVFRYTALPWEANRFGGLHGGIISAMLDVACGVTVTAYTGHRMPTLSLNVEFIRPAAIGDTLLATAWIISSGRQITRVRGELRKEDTGKLIASCTANFFSKEV